MKLQTSSRRFGKILALACGFALIAVACSSDSTDSPAAPVETTAAASPQDTVVESSDAGDSSDFDCNAMEIELGAIRNANGILLNITDAETVEAFGLDFDKLESSIAALRPIQDIEGIFGTGREGLDNMSADIAAIREERFDDKVGDYGVVAITAVVAEEICGN